MADQIRSSSLLPKAFTQEPPRLGNQYDDDSLLRSYLRRALPPESLAKMGPSLREMGELAGGELYELQREDRGKEPTLTRWDPWGRRIDEVEVTPLWRRAEEVAARHGVVATAYEAAHGPFSRIHQFALAYLFTPSTDFYSCPLAMTDGAARTLLESDNRALIDRAVPHLTSRDPERFWTSGQWMTEATGGSDVGLLRTVARHRESSEDGEAGWRLWGHKWFTSAVASRMALTLARPEENGPGGKGLALFYLETRDADGLPAHLPVHRLKDKLGTRKLPTAELTLDGTPAWLVGGTTDGIRAIAPMLNITRTWNGVTAVALMRRGLALAADYARRRKAFGAPLSEKPLHVDTLAGLAAEHAGAFHLVFRGVELLGRLEAGQATGDEARLLRCLTPILKLTSARQSVAVAGEVLEAFGGAGYVEDTGLPALLRDSQVLTIWEGTTNVLALDTFRALSASPGGPSSGFQLLQFELHRCLTGVSAPELEAPAQAAREALSAAGRWLAFTQTRPAHEAGARRFALTTGRALEAALLVQHAHASATAGDQSGAEQAAAAARRLARNGLIVGTLPDPGGEAQKDSSILLDSL